MRALLLSCAVAVTAVWADSSSVPAAAVATPASLDVTPARKPLTRKGPHLGTFKLSRWSLNGSAAELTMPTLTLKADGEYAFGGAKGKWTFDEGGLMLLGPYLHWGLARVRADGDELVFDYTRGGAHFEVVMARELEPPAQALR